MGDIYTNPPQSRNEEIIRATIDGTEYTDPPQSRMEDLLIELKEAIEEGGGGGGSSELADDLTTSVTVGGITSGTQYEAGTSLEKIFRDMLNPVAYPTLTNPSVSLAGSGSKLLEAGATLAVTLTATFSRGSINPAYGTSGYRSGAVQGYTLNSGTEQAENTWSETVSEANKTFKCSARYAAGEQPKDSVGNDYSTPLPAGSVESGTVTYDFVDAMWANTSNITTVAKLSLVAKSTKQRDMTFPAQTVANPEIFDIPASWTVTAVQVKNDLSVSGRMGRYFMRRLWTVGRCLIIQLRMFLTALVMSIKYGFSADMPTIQLTDILTHYNCQMIL